MQSGKVTGYEITKNKGSEKNKLVLQLEISDPEDIQSIQLISSSGEVSNPPNGSKVITIPIGTNGYKVGVAVDDNIEPEQIEPGEKIIYSSDDGTIKSKIYLKKTGEIIAINDNGSFKLAADGSFQAINDKGQIDLFSNGSIESINENGDYKLLANGMFQVNGSTKSFVTFAELETSLNAFKSSIEASVTGSVNAGILAHTHVSAGPGVPTATGVGTILAATPSVVIDISASETTTVKTGG